MMALKMASLAQGASGVRPQTIAMLQAMLAADPTLTGFVGGSDAMATGIVNWLRAAGHAVPQQVSVVGMPAKAELLM